MSENFTPDDLRAIADYAERLWETRAPGVASPIVTLWSDRPDSPTEAYCWITLGPRDSHPFISFYDPFAAEVVEGDES